MKNTPPENSHVSDPSRNDDAVRISTEPKEVPQSIALRLVPRTVRERKFRAHSFIAKLAPVQRTALVLWVKTLPTREIIEKVATPPPDGFGLKVCATTIDRLRILFRNVAPMNLACEALDTAADLLESHQPAAIPALHEALHLMLYSTALNHASRGAEPKIIDQTLVALTRLEKLRILNTSSPHNHHSPPATHHNIRLTIFPAPPGQLNAPTHSRVRHAPSP